MDVGPTVDRMRELNRPIRLPTGGERKLPTPPQRRLDVHSPPETPTHQLESTRHVMAYFDPRYRDDFDPFAWASIPLRTARLRPYANCVVVAISNRALDLCSRALAGRKDIGKRVRIWTENSNV